MNRYEQLKDELQKEEKKMVQEFRSKAKAGDFAKLGETYGIIGVITHRGDMALMPLNYGMAPSAPIALDETNIPLLTIIGDDFSEVATHLQNKAKEASKREEEIPF